MAGENTLGLRSRRVWYFEVQHSREDIILEGMTDSFGSTVIGSMLKGSMRLL